MKQEVKERWLQALRGGEYHQAHRELVADSKNKCFCCLGVLNDLSQLGDWVDDTYYRTAQDVYNSDQEWSAQGYDNPEEAVSCCGEQEFAHDEVADWAGLDHQNPEITISDEEAERYSLDNNNYIGIADLNDAGMPFSRLAELIEEQL